MRLHWRHSMGIAACAATITHVQCPMFNYISPRLVVLSAPVVTWHTISEVLRVIQSIGGTFLLCRCAVGGCVALNLRLRRSFSMLSQCYKSRGNVSCLNNKLISSNASSKRTHHPNYRITTMSSTSSSTPSLPMSQRQPTPKDYESSFVNLSSQYGFGGSSMPSLPRKSAKTTTPSSSSTSQPTSKSSSVQQSTATHSQKDFEASFAQLSSSYGYGGGFSLPTRQ